MTLERPAAGGSTRASSCSRSPASEGGVRSAHNMRVGPCTPVGVQREKAELAQLLGQLGVFFTPSWGVDTRPIDHFRHWATQATQDHLSWDVGTCHCCRGVWARVTIVVGRGHVPLLSWGVGTCHYCRGTWARVTLVVGCGHASLLAILDT
jgi:hypothetical protein